MDLEFQMQFYVDFLILSFGNLVQKYLSPLVFRIN